MKQFDRKVWQLFIIQSLLILLALRFVNSMRGTEGNDGGNRKYYSAPIIGSLANPPHIENRKGLGERQGVSEIEVEDVGTQNTGDVSQAGQRDRIDQNENTSINFSSNPDYALNFVNDENSENVGHGESQKGPLKKAGKVKRFLNELPGVKTIKKLVRKIKHKKGKK